MIQNSGPPFFSLLCFFSVSPILSTELEARMQVLRLSTFEESQGDDTFAQRAEWFYQRRPLLISLCLDLYNGYVTLLGRPPQTKPNHQLKSTVSHPNQLLRDDDCISDIDSGSEISSEVESTLSFQQMQDPAAISEKVDELVSQLVTANLNKEIMQDELLHKGQQFHEASRTIDLLKNFVTLLEMEKEVAMEENANLSYKLTSLLEENRELATEALFMKNEAVGLARCVLKMRDEHFHKISILQNRIYSLQESRNLDPVYENVSAGCFGLDKNKTKKKKTRNQTEEKTGFMWLKKLNNIKLFTTKCSINPSATPSCCNFNA